MFENDIFISYSHEDDESLLGEPEGWVSDLHRWLSVRIGQHLGEKPKIWRDPQQSGNEYFTDVFLDQLRKTAVLVPVFSPSYFSSPWCPRELAAFFDACESSGGLRVGDHARVFKVLKTRIEERERIPPVMNGFLGYEFFAVDDETKRVQEYWRPFGPEAKLKFIQKAEDLAQDISRLLRQLRGLEPEPNAEVRKRRGFVYLAVTTSDLKEARDYLRRDLDRSGYTVLPDAPLPETSPEIDTAVAAAVARCRLSVHMIGRKYGTVPEGAKVSIPELQNDIAAARSRTADLARLVWLASAQTPDEKQQELILRLQSAPDLQDKMDLLDGSLEDLKEEVHRSLETRPAVEPGPVQESRNGDAPPRVYLVCDRGDKEQAEVQQLRKLLFQEGCEPILPLFEGDETEIRQDHEESLRTCDAVLIYWGAGGERWRRRQKSDVDKSAGLGRAGGKPLTALYVAPPSSSDKESLLTHEALVLRPSSAGPTVALLAPFLDKIRGGSAKGAHEPL